MASGLGRSRLLSSLLIILMLWTYAGGATAAQNEIRDRNNKQRFGATQPASRPIRHEKIRFDEVLSQLKETLGKPVDIQKVTDQRDGLIQEYGKARKYFRELEGFIKEKGLSDEILNRHLEFAEKTEAKYQALMAYLDQVELGEEAPAGFWNSLIYTLRRTVSDTVDRDEAVTETLSFLEENVPRKRKPHFDPDNCATLSEEILQNVLHSNPGIPSADLIKTLFVQVIWKCFL